MIYYFSGTGNSRLVAQRLAKDLNLGLVKLPAPFSPEPAGLTLLVFPIYAWGLPKPVVDFVRTIPSGTDVHSVITYGDDAADAPKILEALLANRGARLLSCLGIQMPNVYTLLPGFDVDPIEVSDRKLEAAPARISEIAAKIRSGEHIFDYTPGSIPGLKTRFVYPLFRKFGIFPSHWSATDSCIRCGKCVKACPMDNIAMGEDGPKWGSDCVSCLGCYHVCPTNAVQYGKMTKGKGQYYAPATLPDDK